MSPTSFSSSGSESSAVPKRDILDKFATSYATGTAPSTVSEAPTEAPNTSLPIGVLSKLVTSNLSLAATVLNYLMESPNRTNTVGLMIENGNMPIEKLLPLIEMLTQAGIITILHRDRMGNHTVQLTGTGETFVKLLNFKS